MEARRQGGSGAARRKGQHAGGAPTAATKAKVVRTEGAANGSDLTEGSARWWRDCSSCGEEVAEASSASYRAVVSTSEGTRHQQHRGSATVRGAGGEPVPTRARTSSEEEAQHRADPTAATNPGPAVRSLGGSGRRPCRRPDRVAAAGLQPSRATGRARAGGQQHHRRRVVEVLGSQLEERQHTARGHQAASAPERQR